LIKRQNPRLTAAIPQRAHQGNFGITVARLRPTVPLTQCLTTIEKRQCLYLLARRSGDNHLSQYFTRGGIIPLLLSPFSRVQSTHGEQLQRVRESNPCTSLERAYVSLVHVWPLLDCCYFLTCPTRSQDRARIVWIDG